MEVSTIYSKTSTPPRKQIGTMKLPPPNPKMVHWLFRIMLRMQSLDQAEFTPEQRVDAMRNFVGDTFDEIAKRGKEFERLATPDFKPLWQEFSVKVADVKNKRFNMIAVSELIVLMGDMINMETANEDGPRSTGGSPEVDSGDSGAANRGPTCTEVSCVEDGDDALYVPLTSDPQVVVKEWLLFIGVCEQQPNIHVVQVSLGKELTLRTLPPREALTRLRTYRVEFNKDCSKAVLKYAL
jgi:hypothetical protein